jgi:hypothetical protein
MYHTHLLISVGDNPDRPDWEIARRWLRNIYRVHQRLCMAFPSTAPAPGGREHAYCRPFDGAQLPHLRAMPAESDGGNVHGRRCGDAGFLFRVHYPVEAQRGGRRPAILVQSAKKPDWDYAFGLTAGVLDDRKRPIGNAAFLLAAPPQFKRISFDLDGDTLILSSPRQNYRLGPGDLVRFRLRANPTRKTQDGSPNGKRKRVEPTREAHRGWLTAKLGDAAASPICIEAFVPGWAYGWQGEHEPEGRRRMQWWSVLFEGRFRVGDTVLLKGLLESGIGSAKAFGFGLLSVAPA